MTPTPKPLSWHDLAPWHYQSPMDYSPEGYMPDTGDYVIVEVDGVEYVTDRYMIVRRDMLDGSPSSWQHPFPPGIVPSEDAMRALITPSDEPGATWLAPFYLDLAERLGVTPVAHGKHWFLRDDEGRLLAVIAGSSPGGLDRPVTPPMLPGYDLARARIIAGYLDYDLGAQRRWWQAVAVVAELDALNAQKETDR